MDLRTHLKREYVERKRRNANYSLRAFAKALDLDQSLLSKILRGVREPTSDTVIKVSQRLGVRPTKLKTRKKSAYSALQIEATQLLAHWEHFAILELVKTKGFRTDLNWIAKRLQISVIEVEVAVRRLEAFGFLVTNEKQWRLKRPNTSWTNFSETSPGKVHLQKKLLEKATEAIDRLPFDRRENASLTLQCSRRLIPEVKKKVDQFLEEIDKFIEDQGPHDDVYQVVIGFFPLTQSETN